MAFKQNFLAGTLKFNIYALLTRTKRCSLLDYLEKEYRIKISRMSPNKIFMFLIPPPPPAENFRIVKTQKLKAKHAFESFETRKG